MIRFRLCAIVLLLACAPPDDQETGSIDREEMEQAAGAISADVRARIDSGNAAFRRDDFARASQLYREAAQLDDDAAAAWFGIYMAETALRNPGAADSALARARKLKPGASLLHVKPGDLRADSAEPRR